MKAIILRHYLCINIYCQKNEIKTKCVLVGGAVSCKANVRSVARDAS